MFMLCRQLRGKQASGRCVGYGRLGCGDGRSKSSKAFAVNVDLGRPDFFSIHIECDDDQEPTMYEILFRQPKGSSCCKRTTLNAGDIGPASLHRSPRKRSLKWNASNTLRQTSTRFKGRWVADNPNRLLHPMCCTKVTSILGSRNSEGTLFDGRSTEPSDQHDNRRLSCPGECTRKLRYNYETVIYVITGSGVSLIGDRQLVANRRRILCPRHGIWYQRTNTSAAEPTLSSQARARPCCATWVLLCVNRPSRRAFGAISSSACPNHFGRRSTGKLNRGWRISV
ncbi:hypothetical protein ACVJGD_008110 [Bradyrhizobium sp. USDA 10063]